MIKKVLRKRVNIFVSLYTVILTKHILISNYLERMSLMLLLYVSLPKNMTIDDLQEQSVKAIDWVVSVVN